MTEARVEETYADRESARALLEQAEIFIADATRASNANESRAVLAHNAVIAASDAVLSAVGLRVKGGDGAHVLRIERAIEELAGESGDLEDLSERLDALRERRNEASYSALPVASASIDDALEATAEFIELVRSYVS